MKPRTSVFILGFLCLFNLIQPVLAATFPDAFTQNRKLGRGVNILGYDPIWKSQEKGRFQARYFRLLKETGFSTVRINLHPFRHMEQDADYRLPASWWSVLDWAVEHALQQDLMVILDMHEFNAIAADPVGKKPMYLAFWRQVAQHYRDAPSNVLFELLNEPNRKLTPELWNQWLVEALAIVRADNPERTVIIGPGHWNAIDHLDTLELPETDRQIIVTVHYYKPMAFTHQGASWAPKYTETGIAWGSPAEKQILNETLDQAQAWSERHQRPLFLGEFGAYDKAPLDSRVAYTQAVARAAEQRNWSWAYWQFDSNFSVYDTKKDTWFEPILHALMPRTENTQNWTRFRGPNGQGVVPGAALPVQWDANSVTWRTPLPGPGHSSPVVWGDQVYVTSCLKDPPQGVIVALDVRSGQILWQTPVPLKRSKLNKLNSYASSTPVVHTEGLYVIWPSGDELLLTAFGHNGQRKWSRNYGPVVTRHGPCISPILYKGLLIFSQEHYEEKTEKPGRWLAVDCRSGDMRWELLRNNASPSYITPCLYKDKSGQDQLIFTSQAHGMTAIAPATGHVIWELPGLFKSRTIGSPVLAKDCIIAASGSAGGGKTLVFVRPGSAHTKPQLLHVVENKLIPYVPSMIVAQDRLYTFHDAGTLSCWDIADATVLWSERLKAKFYGSPIAIGDHIYCTSRKGEVFVVQAGDHYRLLGVNALGEASQSTPAVVDDKLLLRSLTAVTCVTPQ